MVLLQSGRENKACNIHNKIGKIVRNAIKEAGRNYARKNAYSQEKFKRIRKRKEEFVEINFNSPNHFRAIFIYELQ